VFNFEEMPSVFSKRLYHQQKAPYVKGLVPRVAVFERWYLVGGLKII
jgi:hypothetical protein